MAYLQVNDLVRKYIVGDQEVFALKGVSFEVDEGELVVILGASGAGKSTLLNILGGMDRPTSGKYIIDHEEISSYDDRKLQQFRYKDIGFIFQFYNLIPNLTAYENVLFASLKDGDDPKAVLEKVGLSHRLNNFPSNLSGGEQQRVSIARALVKKPKLLLCDEPTGALDSKTGAQIIRLLCDMARTDKKTVLIVTHNSNIAKVADRIIRISDGQIISNEKNENIVAPEEVDW